MTPPTGVEVSEDKKTMTVSDVQKERPDGTSSLMNVQCEIENKHGSLIGSGYLNALCKQQFIEITGGNCFLLGSLGSKPKQTIPKHS